MSYHVRRNGAGQDADSGTFDAAFLAVWMEPQCAGVGTDKRRTRSACVPCANQGGSDAAQCDHCVCPCAGSIGKRCMNPRNFGMVVCSSCNHPEHRDTHRPNRRRNACLHSNTYDAFARPSPTPSPALTTARGYDNVGVVAAAAKRQQPSPSCVDGLESFESCELGSDVRAPSRAAALLPTLESDNGHDAIAIAIERHCDAIRARMNASGETTCSTRVCEGAELGAAAHCVLGPDEFGDLCGLLACP